MFVSDIMTTNAITIGPDDTLRTAIERMKSIECRRLPVVNTYGDLIGIVTDRDTRLAMQSPYESSDTRENDTILDSVVVRDCMTPAPITVEPTTDLVQATSLMLRHHIGGLPVLRGESLVGIVTSTDILSAFVRLLQAESQPRNISG
jgi:acetoin utilization protein AcuB